MYQSLIINLLSNNNISFIIIYLIEMKRTVIFLALCLCGIFVNAQECLEDENIVVVEFYSDQYGYETSWNIIDGQGNELAAGENFDNTQLYIDSLCLPEWSCLTFSVFDSHGDGLLAPAYISIKLNDVEIYNITTFTKAASISFDCLPGQSCDEAIVKGEGAFPFNAEGEWFKFTPSVNGIYSISTCDNVVCDTKIWVYDECNNILIVDGHEGTTFYADLGDCGVQAEVSGVLITEDDYYIRVRAEDPTCTGDSLAISFIGAISGCTDPEACNYNPLATEDDGSCVLDGSDCPKPDLLMSVGALQSSMTVRQEINNDECLINEGCMRGYGVRDVISFRTVIANIGDADYFVGQPEENPDQFDFDNCHDHFHYGGYAEYVLYDEYGQYIPIGFKNGFCVIDLSCPSQDMYKYSCNYMGISAGCTDIYNEDLVCQWIDITDVPDGNYTFVTRVNWDNAPDALGQTERDSLNNWAQVCITLDRSSGELLMEQVEDCEPYLDCLGNLYGKVEVDCNGECDGPAIRGDVDEDGILSGLDRANYSDQALEEVAATSCSDLNGDGLITVYDAVMLSYCMLFGDGHVHEDGSAAHDHCSFPAGIYNGTTPTQFEITAADNNESYFIVSMRNSSSDIMAYQFKISGVTIKSIENIVDGYMAESMLTSVNTNNLLVMSESNSFIPKSAEYSPVLKIYYSAPMGSEVCVEIMEVVNINYEQVTVSDPNICASLDALSTSDYIALEINIFPNPFRNETLIQMKASNDYTVKMYDASGRLVRTEYFEGDNAIIKRGNLFEGVYFMTVQSDKVTFRSKVIIQ